MKRILDIIWKTILIIAIFISPIIAINIAVPYEMLSLPANRMDIVSLYISAYSLVMSVFIAILIYLLQNSDVKRDMNLRKKRAQSMMYAELEIALEGIYMRAAGLGNIGTGVNTKNVMNIYLAELQDILNPAQFRLLISLVNKIDIEANDISDEEEKGIQARKELIGYMRPWVVKIMESDYVKFFSLVRDFYDLLDQPLFELLNTLGKTNTTFDAKKSEIYDKNGNVLFSFYDNKWQIFDGNGLLLVDGSFGIDMFDTYRVVDGYEKGEEYIGHYKDGKYDGVGTLLGYYNRKKKKGMWKDGELISGMEYDWLVEKHGEDSWDFYEQYGDEGVAFYFSSAQILYIGMENFYVVDLNVEKDGQKIVNIRTLEEFLEKNNPQMLEHFIRGYNEY